MTTIDEELRLSLIDYYAPDAPKDWIDLELVLAKPLLERIKYAYYATLGYSLDEAKAKAGDIVVFQGSLRALATSRMGLLKVKGDYETEEDGVMLGELAVLSNELGLISFAGQDFVLVLSEYLVEHYRSLHN